MKPDKLLIGGLWLLFFAWVVSAQTNPDKKVLAVGASAGWQHESISEALTTVLQIGRETGLWETVIRTDTQLLTKRSLTHNARNLDDFDAVFFFTSGELPLDSEQKQALLSFVRSDGKGFLGAHSATDTFYEWPEFEELLGGYFDGHPWNRFDAAIVVEDSDFPAVRHLSPRFQVFDEIYQIRGFSLERSRLLLSLDTSAVDMNRAGVKHQQIPVAWYHHYGRGRVFYCGLGHEQAVWQRPDIRKMWLEAFRWTLGLADQAH